MYQRGSRLVNLKILLVVEDGAGIDNNNQPVSQALLQVAESPAVKPLLGWTRHDYADEDWIVNEVWKEKYWGAIYVTSNNVSQQLVQALEEGRDLNTSMLVRGYFETGRDPNGMNSYVEPGLLKFGAAFNDIMQQEVYPRLLSQLSSEQFANLQNSTTLYSMPEITLTDGVPVSDYTVMAPLQVGLIYIIIVTELYHLSDGDCAGQLPADFARIQLCECRVPDQAQQRVEGGLWCPLDDLVPHYVGGGRRQREHGADLFCCAAAADGILAGVFRCVQHLSHFFAYRGVSGVLPVHVRYADQELVRAHEGASFQYLPWKFGQELWHFGGVDRSQQYSASVLSILLQLVHETQAN
ncbi:hypothetical protein KL907_004137 [Ogataea polymorpha]|nr:hypothetical protein KL907_004137 [Ogataea polymorpha]